MKLLLVDDEPLILRALDRVLRRAGHELFFAASAHEALEILRRTPIDVVVADNRMPTTSGAELLRRVQEELPGAVRMLMSAVDDQECRRAEEDGVAELFIEKPWDPEALLQLFSAERIRR